MARIPGASRSGSFIAQRRTLDTLAMLKGGTLRTAASHSTTEKVDQTNPISQNPISPSNLHDKLMPRSTLLGPTEVVRAKHAVPSCTRS